jgi:hypothetical protein
MSQMDLAPDEFARLMSLPPEHPDRRRVEADPRFEAWSAMLRTFESPSPVEIDETEVCDADHVLAKRTRSMLGLAAVSPPVPSHRETHPRDAQRERAGWTRWLNGHALRPAFALATAVVVVGGAWWLFARGTSQHLVRGSDRSAIQVTEARSSAGTTILSWTRVRDADSYRVVFYGADLGELAHVDVAGTTLDLRADALPSGLASGAETAIEVVAMRGDDPVARSKTRTLRLP